MGYIMMIGLAMNPTLLRMMITMIIIILDDDNIHAFHDELLGQTGKEREPRMIMITSRSLGEMMEDQKKGWLERRNQEKKNPGKWVKHSNWSCFDPSFGYSRDGTPRWNEKEGGWWGVREERDDSQERNKSC